MLGYRKHDTETNVLITILWGTCLSILFMFYLLYCGFTTMYAYDGELIGQAKKLTLVKPFWSSFCPEYYSLDVSLGILKNGVGSLSKEDLSFTVLDRNDLTAMLVAVETGAIVKVKYNTRRLAACTEGYLATGFQIE